MQERILGLDTETMKDYFKKDSLRSIQIYNPQTQKVIVLVKSEDGQEYARIVYDPATDEIVRTGKSFGVNRVKDLLCGCKYITHFGLFDCFVLKRDLGIDIELKGDSFVYGSLVPYPKPNMSRSLENLMKHEVDPDYDKGAWEDHDWETPELTDEAIKYGARDAKATFDLERVMKKRLPNYNNKIYRLEVALIPVLARMKLNGISVDKLLFESALSDFKSRVDEIQGKINDEAGKEINVKSRKQLASWIYDDRRNEPKILTPKGAPSVSEDALKMVHDPIIETVLEAVHLRSILSSMQNLTKKNYYEEENGTMIFFPDFKPLSPSYGGRIYTNKPSVNQFPWELRKAVKPRSEGLFYYADVNAFELMVIAYAAGEKSLISVYQDKLDLHKLIASEIYDVSMDEVTPEQRECAKTVVFAIVYGSKGESIARKLQISRQEAKDIIEEFFRRFPEIFRFREELVEKAVRSTVVWTRMGRCRKIYVDDVEVIERKAFNFYAQSGSADIMKRALVYLDRKLPVGCKLAFTVFDSVLIEIDRPERKEQLDQMLDYALKFRGWNFNFESGLGETWFDAKEASNP